VQPRTGNDDDELAEFHAGSGLALARCYREQFDAVAAAVGRVLQGADHETVVHEVFLRLMTDERLRKSFAGGSLRAWLATVAHKQAIDYRRRRDREQPLDDNGQLVDDSVERGQKDAEARRLVERFAAEMLPGPWARVFELRFVQRLDCGPAARALGISRALLAYRELRVRARLARYLRRAGA
jgi:RNA polymerase sigma-70 factor (ECF subfamily)